MAGLKAPTVVIDFDRSDELLSDNGERPPRLYGAQNPHFDLPIADDSALLSPPGSQARRLSSPSSFTQSTSALNNLLDMNTRDGQVQRSSNFLQVNVKSNNWKTEQTLETVVMNKDISFDSLEVSGRIINALSGLAHS